MNKLIKKPPSPPVALVLSLTAVVVLVVTFTSLRHSMSLTATGRNGIDYNSALVHDILMMMTIVNETKTTSATNSMDSFSDRMNHNVIRSSSLSTLKSEAKEGKLEKENDQFVDDNVVISLNHGEHNNTKNLTVTGHAKPLGKHPHAGARYPDGTYGYVADVTAVRQYYLKLYQQHYKQQQHPRHHEELFDPHSEGYFNDSHNSTNSTQATTTTHRLRRRRPDIHPMYTFLPFVENDILFLKSKSTGKIEYDYVCNTPPGTGHHERREGYELVMQRIQVNADNPPSLEIANTSLFRVNTIPIPPSPSLSDADDDDDDNNNNKRRRSRSRLLCVVYTYHKGKYRMAGITSTWGWRCDGFFAASTMTQMDNPHAPGFGMVDLPHRGAEKYGNMWQKTRSILGYIHDNYLDQFDYVYIVGDDTHLVVENLRNYLESLETELNITVTTAPAASKDATASRSRTHDNYPLYLGHPVPFGKYVYAGGGSGYVLNRAAIRKYMQEAKGCSSHMEISAEDRYLGLCLRQIDISLYPTHDRQNRTRFIGLSPASLGHPNLRYDYFKDLRKYQLAHGLGVKRGKDQVSTQLVSLHLFKQAALMKRHHALLYRTCPLGTLVGDAQWEFDQQNVPTPEAELREIERHQMEKQQQNS